MARIKQIISLFTKSPKSKELRFRFWGWLTNPIQEQQKDDALFESWNLETAVSKQQTELAYNDFIKSANPTKRKKLGSSFTFGRVAVAAAIAMLICVSGLQIHQISKTNNQIYHIVTAENSKGRYTLPDGSVVWLSEDSELSYGGNFGRRDREVTLSGGALFEVEHDAAKPFNVELDGINVTVLGTIFDVQNDKGRNEQIVVLVEGLVAISRDDIPTSKLHPNEMYSYNNKTGKGLISSVKGCNYTTWIDQTMIFDDTPLSDAIIQIGRKYNVEIMLSPDVDLDRNINFEICAENLPQTLSILSVLLEVEYTTNQDQILITNPKKMKSL